MVRSTIILFRWLLLVLKANELTMKSNLILILKALKKNNWGAGRTLIKYENSLRANYKNTSKE